MRCSFARVAAIVLSVLFLFNSCGKESNSTDPVTTVDQDKAFFHETVTNTNDCITAARDGNLSQSVIHFFDFSNGVSGNETWVDSLTNALQDAMGTIEYDPENAPLNLSQFYGTYTWNRVTKTFSKVAANGVFINFPSAPEQTTNNVTINFLEFTEAMYQANARDIYLPLRARANIVKDNVTIANLDFTASYSSGDFPRPLNVSFNLLMTPHNYSFTIQEVNSTKFNFSSQLISGQGCGITINSTVTFKNDDYNNFDAEEDLSNITADYTSGDFGIKAGFDANTYYALSDPSTENLNSSLVTDVYNKTQKIGELKFQDVSGERKLYIFYKDSTSENTSAYYDPFTTNLKNTLRPMFGDDVDSWF